MKILLTGSSGFLGKTIVNSFIQHRSEFKKSNFILLTPSSADLNLLNHTSTMNYFFKAMPDVVIHLAARVGGIGLNKKCPADLTHLNLKMLVNLFDAIREFDTQYFYGAGTCCSYPENISLPFIETDIWQGESQETNRGYSESKKMMITEFNMHKKQYGLSGAILIPSNLFGPMDGFNLETSHVIPALIRKFYEAKLNNDPEVKCWGTGGASREFLYSVDASEAFIIAVTKQIDTDKPINIGTGKEITIKDLSHLIAKLVEYDGEIVYTGEVSDGQPRRSLNVSRAKEVLGWEAKVELEDGLKETIKWYKDNREYIIKQEEQNGS
jgi:GDP-L-fucose synthase